MAKRKPKQPLDVETLTHEEASRLNIPSAEHQSLLRDDERDPIPVAYARRNRDLDPQLVWRGKDEQDWSDLVVQAPPLYIQEKVQPKVLIDDLRRQSQQDEADEDAQTDLFAQFDGLDDPAMQTEFYQHDANWANRMILGDSLHVMASLAEREGLRGQVQCIYLDPPYGIKFNSNFQWSTTSRDVKDGKAEHITREPEQVKAFRDTWRDGIHSYLTYLRDRLTVCRDLLTESGSIFVQIGDENVHRVRALMDEVFGDENSVALIAYHTTSGSTSAYLSNPKDYVLWYAKSSSRLKFRQLKLPRPFNYLDPGPWRIVESQGERISLSQFLADGGSLNSNTRLIRIGDATSQRQGREAGESSAMGFAFRHEGDSYTPSGTRGWSTTKEGMTRAARAGRLYGGKSSLGLVRYFDESPYYPMNSAWDDTGGTIGAEKTYVVQANTRVVQRCLLMTTDPGDLVLDPTCGSGTTAAVAEQWGRRWITIDTSRVALALARARVMGARYPFYLLKDSRDGQLKEAEISRSAPSEASTTGNIRQGFVYERVPHITLRDIANNAEIDVIYERFQAEMEPIRKQINAQLADHESELARKQSPLEAWQMPREPGTPWPEKAQKQHERFMRVKTDSTKQKAVNKINTLMGRSYTIETLPEHPVDPWSDPELIGLHTRWWKLRIARQKEIDASIAAKAEFEYLYDKPYEDKSKVRVAGPFTVESLLPHRVVGLDENDDLIDGVSEPSGEYGETQSFAEMVLENLKTAGVQQAHKEDRITFTSLTGWPGHYLCAEGTYTETQPGGDGETAPVQRRAGIFIGPEFGTVARPDLVEAAREAADAGFDVLIACAFNYDAHASEFSRLGRVPILKARMNADLHMGDDLKNTGKGNLFVIFGEPDIDLIDTDDGQLQVKINGVDVFHPNSGEVRSNSTDGIACWFIDTDYNSESFFVRHAYFLGANDPYQALKTTLKAEINEDAWATLHSDTSRPFDKPASGRIAVKVINHLGDEVMKVYRVS